MIHLLWVIFVLYLIHRLIQFSLRRFTESIRYSAACAMLFVVALVAVVFLLLPWVLQYDFPLVQQLRGLSETTGLSVIDTQRAGHDAVYYSRFEVQDRWLLRAWAAWAEPMLSWLGVVWGVGIVWRLLPSLRGTVGLMWVVRQAVPSSIDLADPAFDRIRNIVSGRTYPVLESQLIDGPCVAGWLKPVILLPIGLATQIRPDLLECILSHELAHIRRRDFAVNIIQIATESFLFFHPCVKWLSNEIRVLREACCDDTAIATTGSSKTFAESLLAVEHLRPGYELAMGMSDASVPSRVNRLVVLRYQPPRNGYRRFFSLLLTVVMLLMIGAMPASGIAEDYEDQVQVAEQGVGRAVLEGMDLRRDNPELWPALQRFARETTSYRDLKPEQLRDLVEIASRGGREDQVLRARLPWLRLEMQPAYDNPDVIWPTDSQISHISHQVFYHTRSLPAGPDRDKWMRAAVVLSAQEGWTALPNITVMVKHERFEELSGCSSQTMTRFRRLVSIAETYMQAGSQAVWDAEDSGDATGLPDLLDRFTYPLAQRRFVAAAAAHSLPIDSPARRAVAAKLRATGIDYDAKLADLVEQPLTGVRAYVGRPRDAKIIRRIPRPPEPPPPPGPVN